MAAWAREEKPAVFRPPWPAALAAFVAFAALTVTSGGGLVPALLGLALVAVYFTDARLPDDAWLSWLIRAAVFALVLFTDPGPADSSVDWPISAGAMQWIALMCGAELVLQSWRRHPQLGKGGMAVFPLAALIFMAACNTFETAYVRFLAPAFILCVAFALRSYRPRAEATGVSPAPGWTALALAAALGIGAGMHFIFHNYVRGVDQWAAQFVTSGLSQRTSGFSASPTLGASFDLRQSTERVLRIEGLEGTAHLRGMAYDRYTGGSWGPALTELEFVAADLEDLRSAASGPRARIARLQDSFHLLFLPLNAAGAAPMPGTDAQWAPDGGPAVRSQGRPFLPYGYEAVLPDREGFQGPLCAAPNASERERLLLVPHGVDPGVRELARRIVAGLTSPRERVRAVESYLVSNHRYSLSVRPGAGDPVSSFLLEKKAAHCQYFGSSAVILLRCLGVPARYVQGYYAHEGAGPGVTVVRGRDAHAWAEAWIDGEGWINVEATPGDGRPDAATASVSAWQGLGERLQDGLLALGAWLATRSPVEWLALVGALFGVLIAFPLWRSRRGQRAAAAETLYSGAPPELTALAARFERYLRRQGSPCPPHRTWEEHLALLTETGAAGSAAAAAFLREYNTLRFGTAKSADSLARLSNLLRELE